MAKHDVAWVQAFARLKGVKLSVAIRDNFIKTHHKEKRSWARGCFYIFLGQYYMGRKNPNHVMLSLQGMYNSASLLQQLQNES